MKPEYFLGIDTSNYTTSLAVISADGELLLNAKRPLTIEKGARGLRQSEAVFAHVKNLPSLWEEAEAVLSTGRLAAVGVSMTPRHQAGSYMPCFLSGVAAATSAATAAGVPLYRFSHQCGHLAAAILSSGRYDLFDRPFGAFHVSGGTTEVLYVSGISDGGFSAEILGGAVDLHAGQVIDRVGVMLGLDFPCGPALERLAAENVGRYPAPRISVRGMEANLSGLENLSEKLWRESGDARLVAAYVLDFIGKTLVALTEELLSRKGSLPVLYGGGVMSNRRIRSMLSPLGDTAFAEPALSADNAAGIALLCQKRHGGSL